MAAAVEKIDMSLDEIIKLNKKKLVSSGGGRGRGAGRGRGRGGITRGEGRGGRGSTGVSPLNRNDTGYKKFGRFSNSGTGSVIRGAAGRGTRGSRRGTRGSGRGTRGSGRGTRGSGRGTRGTGRGTRGNRGAGRGLQQGKTFNNQQGTTNNYRGGSLTFYNQSRSNFQRGAASKSGSTASLTRGTGRPSARGRRGQGYINQQKDAMVEVIKKAKRTLQQLNAQQKRQNGVSLKRGIAQTTISPSRSIPVPEKKRRWNNRSVQPYSQESPDQVLTVLVDNKSAKRSPNNSQRNKPKKISNKVRQQVMQNVQNSKQSYNSFSAPTTSLSLNQRFGGQQQRQQNRQKQQQHNALSDTDRQVFF